MSYFKALFLAFSSLFLLATNAQAQARTLYFLPPSEEKWIAGNSYLYDETTQEATLMQIDTTKCGWFEIIFSSESMIPEKVLIYLGSQGKDKLDSNGTGASLSDTAWLPLRREFGTSAELYFVADNLVFTTTSPAGTLGEIEDNRCSYKMAAFIYDTDGSVNPSFSGRYVDPAPNGGLRRGIVLPDLDIATRKPVWNPAEVNHSTWKSKESFEAAFIPKGVLDGEVSNIPRCYDMPFSRASGNNWEFDSDKIRTPVANNANLVGGFYPYILSPAYNMNSDGSQADYSDCTTCNSTYTANCFFSMRNANTLNAMPTVTHRGTTYSGVEAFNRAYLDNGWNNTAPYNPYNTGTYGCANPSPNNNNTTSNQVNLSFCFESHSEFIYEKGQEFFFRGDDDIWVFINNRLVIDLGGVHNPAPGYVDLDTIKIPIPLVEGESYPIDIFFCERLGTQSNVRVSTNMYIVQRTSFYNDPGRADDAMCTSISGDGTCAGRASTTASNSQNVCGENLINAGFEVEFYMVQRGTQTQIPLSGIRNPTNCTGTDRDFTCYGGIKVLNAVYNCGGYGQCKGNSEATKMVDVPLGSNYTVYARLMKNGKQQGKPIIIDGIKSQFVGEIPIDTADFYMINRDTQDTVWLSAAKNQNCSGTGPGDFSCYGGIKVVNSFYSCGGASQCKDNAEATARVNITGNFDVYANALQEGNRELILIDNINSDISPILPRFLANNIKARTQGNTIILENLPKNTKVKVYNLQGKLVYSAYPENPQILKILVQTKGVYVVKIGTQTMRVVVR